MTQKKNLKKNKPSESRNTRKNKVIEMFLDTGTLRERPISEAIIEKFAKSMIEHFSKPENLKLSSFLYKYGVVPSTYYRWRKKFKVLNQVHELVMFHISETISHLAMERKYDTSMTKFMAPFYSEYFEDLAKKNSNINNNDNSSSGNFVIQMSNFDKEDNKDD